jgi:hypothetical protein
MAFSHHRILPVDLLAGGSAEVRQHGGEIVLGRVMTADRIGDDDFRVIVSSGWWRHESTP